jgi:hypothetical protein
MRTTLFILLIVIAVSCKKSTEPGNCGCNSATTEDIDNVFGVIAETDDGFEIISDEKGLLLPCSALPQDAKKDGQTVVISGKLKTSCKEIPQGFPVTPIEISSLELRVSGYDKKDITLGIIKSEDYGLRAGFGYYIEDLRSPNGTKILQPEIPAMPGFDTFCSNEQATKTGVAQIYLIRRNQGALGEAFLKYIHVLSQCHQAGL